MRFCKLRLFFIKKFKHMVLKFVMVLKLTILSLVPKLRIPSNKQGFCCFSNFKNGIKILKTTSSYLFPIWSLSPK